jgi:hypothetical protein
MAGLGNSFDKLARSGRIGTYVLTGLLAATFVLAWLTGSHFFSAGLAFAGFAPPWGFITYPFAVTLNGGELIWLLFLLLWFYWLGCDLERELKTPTFVGLFFAATVVGSAAILLCAKVFGGSMVLVGPMIPIGAVTVAWGVRNLNSSVRLWAVIPITGKWIAIIEALLVLFAYGQGMPVRGVFALIPLGLAWAYAANRIPGVPFGPLGTTIREGRALLKRERNNKVYFDDVRKREKERADRERLRKLLEGSVNDDPSNDK